MVIFNKWQYWIIYICVIDISVGSILRTWSLVGLNRHNVLVPHSLSVTDPFRVHHAKNVLKSEIEFSLKFQKELKGAERGLKRDKRGLKGLNNSHLQYYWIITNFCRSHTSLNSFKIAKMRRLLRWRGGWRSKWRTGLGGVYEGKTAKSGWRKVRAAEASSLVQLYIVRTAPADLHQRRTWPGDAVCLSILLSAVRLGAEWQRLSY